MPRNAWRRESEVALNLVLIACAALSIAVALLIPPHDRLAAGAAAAWSMPAGHRRCRCWASATPRRIAGAGGAARRRADDVLGLRHRHRHRHRQDPGQLRAAACVARPRPARGRDEAGGQRLRAHRWRMAQCGRAGAAGRGRARHRLRGHQSIRAGASAGAGTRRARRRRRSATCCTILAAHARLAGPGRRVDHRRRGRLGRAAVGVADAGGPGARAAPAGGAGGGPAAGLPQPCAC